MSNHSNQNLDEVINDLSFNKDEIEYVEWKSDVQKSLKVIMTFPDHKRKILSVCCKGKTFLLSAEELQSERKTDLTPKEEYFVLCEHLRHVQLMENLDSSSAPIIGAVFTYQNMYSSHVKNLKDVPSIESKMEDLEKDFEENFDRSSVLCEGKRL
jgi:hypothetical protein